VPIEDVNGMLQELIDNGKSGNTGLQKLVQQPYAEHRQFTRNSCAKAIFDRTREPKNNCCQLAKVTAKDSKS
jgi:hypothetical protein